jgi:DnaJ like chaperone protein
MTPLVFWTRYRPGQYPDWVVALVFFGPIVIGLTYLIAKEINDRKWKKGIFPPDLEYNRDGLMEAYFCLAAYIMQRDNRDSRDKMVFIQSYFNKHFPGHEYQLLPSIKWSYEYPMRPKTVATWIKRHIKDEAARLNILYFLGGIAFTDGLLIEKEYKVLKEITPILGLSQEQLDAVINMHQFIKEEEKPETRSATPSETLRHQALVILGLTASAGDTDIKAAYRKLVKVHHPDRLSSASEEHQRLAKEKFLKIQEAYEYLSK